MAAVLKTVRVQALGGSNPSPSAKIEFKNLPSVMWLVDFCLPDSSLTATVTATRAALPLEQGVHDLCCLPVHGRCGVAVEVKGNGDGGMPQHVGHYLRVHPLLQQQRGGGVA